MMLFYITLIGDVMKKRCEMIKVRCDNCNKLLFIAKNDNKKDIKIKCSRCKKINNK